MTKDAPARADRTLVLIIVLIAAVIRLASLGRRPLWLDEQFSVTQALGFTRTDPISAAPTFTPADLWKPGGFEAIVSASARQDSANGILYSLLLRGWIDIVGFGDGRVRLPSVVADLGLVLVVFLFGRALFGRRVALLAALACAVHPLLFGLGREARAYPFATLAALGSSWLFFRQALLPVARPRLGPWMGYGLLASGALLLHYLTIAVLAGHALLALRFVRGRRTWAGVAVAAGLVVIIFSCWMGFWGYRGAESMEAQERSYQRSLAAPVTDNDYVLPATPGYLAAGAAQVSLAISGNFLQQAPGLHLRVLALLLIIPVALIVLAWRREDLEAPRMVPALLLLAVAGPLLALVASLRTGHIVPFQPRYCVFSTPYLILLMALGLDSLRHARPRAYGVLLALGAVVELASLAAVWRQDWLPPSEPHADLAAAVLRRYRPGDVVTFHAWKTARLVTLYLPPTAPIIERVVPGPDPLSVTVAPAER